MVKYIWLCIYIFDCSIGQNRTEKLLTDKQEIGSNEMQIIQYWTEDKKNERKSNRILDVFDVFICFFYIYIFTERKPKNTTNRMMNGKLVEQKKQIKSLGWVS